ncbi:hypothetical protein AB0301_13345 [Microbacterium profundi]|uniref:O-antigen ligase domain-containing protein n=1 Tax=Microbacterium profundi TaxID=450380 RepID=A0ABV3LJF0_9MICO
MKSWRRTSEVVVWLLVVSVVVGPVWLALRAPAVALVCLLVVVTTTALLFIRIKRLLLLSALGSVTVLVVLPSSAVAGLPFGSFYPAIAALALIAVGLVRGRALIRRPPYLWHLWAFFLVVTAATFAHSTPNPFSILIVPLGIGVYVVTFSMSRQDRAAWVIGITSLAVAETVLGLSEVVLGLPPLLGAEFTTSPVNPFMDGGRAQGTLGHPLVLAFLQLVALGLLFASRSGIRGLIVATLLLGGLATTGSASGVVVGLATTLLWFLNRRTSAGTILAVLTTAIVTIVVANAGVVQDIVAAELNPQNVGHRMNSILAVENLIFQRPVAESLFGGGFGAAGPLYASGVLVNDGFYAIDNQFVTFLAQSGLVGASLVIGAFIAITIRTPRVFMPGWLGLLFMGASFDFMAWYVTAALTFSYAAFAMTARREPTPAEKEFRPVSPPRIAARSTVVRMPQPHSSLSG